MNFFVMKDLFAAMELTFPPVVPGYVLQEKLGAGSYAIVYRAYSQAMNSFGTRETVAIKCILRSKLKSKEAADNMIAEISILKQLQHPHVVQLRDFRWDSNYIYLVMEYCSGGDLSAFIRKQRCLPEWLVKKFLQQLAGAMKYLRDRNISHMDLKPQNILLSSSSSGNHPVLKLADFGFAQHLGEGTKDLKKIRGSPLYMAPEMFERKSFDARVDLWSIGVILFESLFGKAPFASETYEELVAKITKPGEIFFPWEGKNISKDCRNLLKSLLNRDPDRRISFDEFFNHPFIDLDHAPSSDSLAKGNFLIREAEIAENQGKPAKSVRFYCRALEYFLPALQFTERPETKARLRAEIQRYIQRAETLKQGLRPRAASIHSQSSFNEIDFLKQKWAEAPQVTAAFTVISAAEDLEADEKFDVALQKYELAIASMLSLIKTEPPDAQRRQLLMNQVQKWMTRAETLKQFLDVQTVSLSRLEQEEKAIDAIEADEEKYMHEQQCTIQ